MVAGCRRLDLGHFSAATLSEFRFCELRGACVSAQSADHDFGKEAEASCESLATKSAIPKNSTPLDGSISAAI
jgi:hypothetical protein